MKWTSIGPIVNAPWLMNHRMPLLFPNGPCIDILPERYKSNYSRQELGTLDAENVLSAKHAFIYSYDAASTRGIVEPMQDNRSMLTAAQHLISLANLALWISKPNGLSFGAVLTFKEDGGSAISNYSRMRRLKPHFQYEDEAVGPDHFINAFVIFAALQSIDKAGPIWRAAYSAWAALRESDWPTRFMQMWISLEALFGPLDNQELSHRISQRIAFFLEDDRIATKALFLQVRESYKWRSKIVHGLHLAKLDPDDSGRLLLFVEQTVARALYRVLTDRAAISQLEAATRDAYLDDFVFQS